MEVYVDDTLVETKALAGGEADVTVGPFSTLGTRFITVKYLGDEHAEPSESDAVDLDGAATVDIAAGLHGVGGHTLTLEYSGDGTFESSTGQVVVTVLPLGATTTTATADDMVYGTDGAVEVTLNGGPFGLGTGARRDDRPRRGRPGRRRDSDADDRRDRAGGG